MSVVEWSVLGIHYAFLAVLCIYGWHRLALSVTAITRYDPPKAAKTAGFYPIVTVQVPLYNERFVAERAIAAAAALRWPQDRLEIQILDDSTDETVEIVGRCVIDLRAQGLDIHHVRRVDRRGFKAGALADAMKAARGDFIAIFDADFTPHPDFLEKVMPHFADPAIGMVQTRWGHLNRNASILTRIQAVLLDAHFAVEQAARSAMGAFFNFNGTGGVWRRQAIAEAGGWQADTLTEDLDLSYRAQLAGWRFLYLRDVDCPGELPGDMNAFKSQQHRWSKGAIEVMQKLLGRIWSSRLQFTQKAEAVLHLTSNLSYMFLVISSVFLLTPSIAIRKAHQLAGIWWVDLPIFVLATFSHVIFFVVGQFILRSETLKAQAALLPALMAASVGIAFNNGRAVLEALVGYKTGFVRTPKTGQALKSDAPRRGTIARPAKTNYRAAMSVWGERVEIVLAFGYLALSIWTAALGLWSVAPFMVLFAAGFGYAGFSSWRSRARFAAA